jgi:hypothetical protein
LCLIDVIGAFHELGYTQTQPGSRKIQINFWMKDLKYIINLFNEITSHLVFITNVKHIRYMYRGTLLSCTLWEDFGLQFLNFTNKSESGPTIILLHNAKIKEATGN